MRRTSSFVTSRLRPSFTGLPPCQPGFPRHLTHDLTALHVLSHSLTFGPSWFLSCLIGPILPLLRPLLTSRSGLHRRPFSHRASEISPGKNAHLHRTIAASTPLRLGHKSFANWSLLALLDSAFYAIFVHRLAVYVPRFLPTLGHPHAVALHFAHCDQLAAGLSPAGVRPCRAHSNKRFRSWLRTI